MSQTLINIIFGMKVRQSRTDAGMTLTEFARQCELSPSYLTEIEKGRKYPRADKIMKMAEALGKSYDDLVSIRLDPSLKYLESTLSSAVIQRFPFEEFGVEPGDLINLLTRQPDKASALLHAILELIRRFDLKEEDFLRAALRSYQEIYENYFPDVEDAAIRFTQEFGQKYALNGEQPVQLSTLETVLQEVYGYEIDDSTITATESLYNYRSIFSQGKRPKLFINNKLYSRQVKFIMARELGHQYLGLSERSHTSPPERIDTFAQLLNDFKASYFAGALLMPRKRFLQDLETFFALPGWDAKQFVNMLNIYNVTPEMLLYRFSELIPQFFGIKLHFLRFHHTAAATSYQLVKQLNMNQLLVPSGIGLFEHYCRRWLSVRLLQEIESKGIPKNVDEMPVSAQMSEFLESGDKFLCMGFSRQMVLNPEIHSSVIVGFRVDANLKHTIRFMHDPEIPQVLISETCERCPLTADQCHLRAAEPTILQARQRKLDRKLALNQLKEHYQ